MTFNYLFFLIVKVNNADEMMQVAAEVEDICPSPSEGLVAVEALMDLISFTPPPVSIRFGVIRSLVTNIG